ncbi:MAG: Multidrug resistance ABC transporter ATP-binding and permease protein [Cellulomonadaceae bacterium TMED98]|nr:MAG: Multidrug resistance ABC transporter ATP-binding and permease protein [Cellulomonadaceae bacterium TMED98]
MRETIRTTWRYLTPRQRLVYASIITGRLVTNLFDLAGIAAIGLLVMAVASGEIEFDIGGFYTFRMDETPPEFIAGLVLLAAVAFLAKALFNLLLGLASVRYMAGVEVKASRKIADHLLSGSLGELRRYSQADIQYAVNPSTGAMYGGVLSALSNIITDGSLMLMILGAFVLVNPVAALVVSIYFAGMVVLIQWFISGRLKQVGRDSNQGSISATSAILDSVASFREVAVLKKQPYFLKRFSDARWLLARTKATEVILRNVPRLIIEQGLMLGVLGFVTWQVLLNDAASGLASVGIFVVGSLRIMGAVMPIQTSYAGLKTTVVKAEMAQQLQREIFEQQPARQELKRALEAAPPLVDSEDGTLGAMPGLSVEMKDVEFTYPDADEPVVTDINLSAEPGGFIAFVGPSGAGKTTLADLVLGLNVPQKGTVLIGGRNPLEIREKHPGLISYVPQKPGMVSGTIAQNIALGIPDEKVDEEWIWQCLRLAALEEVVRGLPGGIHASLGKQSDQLSGGQLQRLGLARALYPKPRLIILDEATSALDASSEAAVSKNIRELGSAVTLIVIAHRLSTIQHADTVYVVDGGKIVASGPFKTLRKTVPMIEESVRLMSFDDTE